MKTVRAKKNPTRSGVVAAAWTIERIANALGVAMEVIADLSCELCSAEVDVLTTERGPVFTQAGFEKIREAVERRMLTTPPAETKPVAAEKKEPATSGLVRADLRVVRVFRGSPRLLANLPNGNEVVLIVRSSEQLQPGMVLPDCERGEMCWYFTGRLPRISGERQHYFPERKELSA